MILVVGGTGILGRELVGRLITGGQAVRVLTRHPERAGELRRLGSEIFPGDIRATAGLVGATSGCTAVVSAAHGFLGGRASGPQVIDDRGNAALLAAAAKAGARRFVLLSVFGARPDHPLELHRAKFAAEQHVRASALDWTILRPTAYLETWTRVVGAKKGGPALVFGRGENPINFVSVRDVAVVVERCLKDNTLHRQVVDVPGPENLSFVEFANRLGATRIRHIPRGGLALLSHAAPIAPALARQAATARFMDTHPMTADPSALHSRFPELLPARIDASGSD